uniref:Uncharacterized protein n=1 Tax=Arion vulgaris TaxID=1028688 RepID=A0A0B7A5J3_9EUPU
MQSALRFANKYPRMQTLVFFIVLWSSGLAFTCLDSIQDPVDWYYVYKIPEMRSSADWKVKAGLAHFYLDVNSPVWTLSGRTINESQQSIYETMSPVYNNKADDTMYLMYNDEPPSNLSYNRGGHTKVLWLLTKLQDFG